MKFAARRLPKSLLVISLLPAFGLLAGCPQRGQLGGIAPAPAKPPPTFPAPKDVPIDQAKVAEARQVIDGLLKSTLPSDHAHAIETYCTTMPDQAAGPITDGLDSKSQIVRFAAAMGTGDIKLQSMKSRLEEHLEDPDPKVKVAVRYALHQLGDKAHSHDLEKLAQDFSTPSFDDTVLPGSYVRGAVAMVLGRMDEPSVVNILYTLRVDPYAGVRQQAEEALFRHGDAKAKLAILGLLSTGQYYDDQLFGLQVLANARQPEYRKFARARLGTGDPKSDDIPPEVALAAARALGEMDDDLGYGVAMLGIKSGDRRQRAMAALAFGAIGRTDSQQYLAPLLKEPDDPAVQGMGGEVRASAATAILRIAKAPKRYNRNGDLLK